MQCVIMNTEKNKKYKAFTSKAELQVIIKIDIEAPFIVHQGAEKDVAKQAAKLIESKVANALSELSDTYNTSVITKHK